MLASLRAQWTFHAPNSDSLEVTPVVVNGMMFVTSANDAWALDAQTGRMVWHYARPITEGLIDDASQHHNRGVGVWGTSIYWKPTTRTCCAWMRALDICVGTWPTRTEIQIMARPARRWW